jgi:hypothetical protein
VLTDTTVAANIKVLVCGLAEYINGETGEARVSTITLARACGFSDAWVRKMVPLLHNSGWAVIEIGSKGRGEKHCNVYKMNPEKRTPCTVLAGRVKRTVKPHFSHLKPHPVFEEPLNHKEEEVRKKESKRAGTAPLMSIDRPIPEPREEIPVTTAVDAPLIPPSANNLARPLRPVLRAAEAAQVEPVDEQQPPCRASGLEIGIATNETGAAAGDAEIVLTTPGYSEFEFQFLRDSHEDRDDEAGSRLAYCGVLRESTDVRETVAMLRRGAGSSRQKTLKQFIEAGDWRSRPAVDRNRIAARSGTTVRVA